METPCENCFLLLMNYSSKIPDISSTLLSCGTQQCAPLYISVSFRVFLLLRDRVSLQMIQQSRQLLLHYCFMFSHLYSMLFTAVNGCYSTPLSAHSNCIQYYETCPVMYIIFSTYLKMVEDLGACTLLLFFGICYW